VLNGYRLLPDEEWTGTDAWYEVAMSVDVYAWCTLDAARLRSGRLQADTDGIDSATFAIKTAAFLQSSIAAATALYFMI